MLTALRPSTAALAVGLGLAAIAHAQMDTFERSFRAGPGARLDVSTHRGKIAITAGDNDEIVVSGTATARSGLNMPVNRGQLVADAVAHPPIRQQGATVEVRPPSDPLVDRAVTIDYVVRVPPTTVVIAASDSGAVTVTAITGAVTVRTQSGAIEVALPASGGVTLDAMTASGTLEIEKSLVGGTVDKGRAHGTIRGGGVLWQLVSKSGTIRVK
ncbi:MAG TPA: DUF4097 family beta strand repeat-containing protein [Vicinamibacterales bacterium]|nr:DUF4097 family beta strand repeat-containing protein [Vicinamibacterales bacterium]